jgi:hypothetical protein
LGAGRAGHGQRKYTATVSTEKYPQDGLTSTFAQTMKRLRKRVRILLEEEDTVRNDGNTFILDKIDKSNETNKADPNETDEADSA